MKRLISTGLFLGLFLLAGVAQAATTVVSGNTSSGVNQSGWLFNRDLTTQTPYEFSNDQSVIGTGSLYVQPITNTVNSTDGNKDKFIAENFLLTPISDVSSISYAFMLGQGVAESKAVHFYMNVYANFGESDPNKFYDCRYNVIPASGSASAFTTVTFDPTQNYPFAQRNDSPQPCPSSPAGMNQGSTTGATIRVMAINVGDTSADDAGVSGYLDNVIVVRTGGTDVYDFEQAPLVVVANNSSPEVVVSNPTQPVEITVESETSNATLNFDALVTDGTGTLPQVEISTESVNVSISASTIVTGDINWDGVINIPTIVSAPEITAEVGSTAVASLAIEVGAGDTALTFDQPVRLTFVGQAGKLAGWVRGGVFSQISEICTDAVNPTIIGEECKIDLGSDLIVWTKHFTTFVTYTQTPIAVSTPTPTGSNSGRRASNIASLAVASTPAATTVAGQVLGAAIGFDDDAEVQAQVVAIKIKLTSLISQLIGLLQSQLAAAIASQR